MNCDVVTGSIVGAVSLGHGAPLSWTDAGKWPILQQLLPPECISVIATCAATRGMVSRFCMFW